MQVFIMGSLAPQLWSCQKNPPGAAAANFVRSEMLAETQGKSLRSRRQGKNRRCDLSYRFFLYAKRAVIATAFSRSTIRQRLARDGYPLRIFLQVFILNDFKPRRL
jgi:hypothetical protein